MGPFHALCHHPVTHTHVSHNLYFQLFPPRTSLFCGYNDLQSAGTAVAGDTRRWRDATARGRHGDTALPSPAAVKCQRVCGDTGRAHGKTVTSRELAAVMSVLMAVTRQRR